MHFCHTANLLQARDIYFIRKFICSLNDLIYFTNRFIYSLNDLIYFTKKFANSIIDFIYLIENFVNQTEFRLIHIVRRKILSRSYSSHIEVKLKHIGLFRDDSALRALSSLRGLRGAPEVSPLCRETSVSRTANVGTVGKNGLRKDGIPGNISTLLLCETVRPVTFNSHLLFKIIEGII